MHHTQDKLDKNQKTEFLQNRIYRTLDLKLKKQISPTCIVLIVGNMNGSINASVSSQKTRMKLRRKVFERIKESKWGTSCKYV